MEKNLLHLVLGTSQSLGKFAFYITIIKTCFIQRPALGIRRESNMVSGLLNSQREGDPEGNLTIQNAFHPKAYWQLSFTSQVFKMTALLLSFKKKAKWHHILPIVIAPPITLPGTAFPQSIKILLTTCSCHTENEVHQEAITSQKQIESYSKQCLQTDSC